MEENKEKKSGKVGFVITIIILLIIVAAIGGYCYYLIKNPKIEYIEKEVEKSNIVDNNKNSNNKIEKSTQNYDGSKNITVNGETYTISYLTEKYKEYEDTKQVDRTELKLYFNDTKIKSLFLYNLNEDRQDSNYEIKLHNFDKQYILIEVNIKLESREYHGYESAYLCIINTQGEYIETFEWSGATSVFSKEENKTLKYEINDDNIILYETTFSYESTTLEQTIVKNKYTISRDIVKKEILKVYNSDEIILAGK